MKKDFSVSMVEANIYALIAALPFIVILVSLYIYILKLRNFSGELFSLKTQDFILFMREWLPSSGEELRDFPLFFHRVNSFPDVPEHEMITDIYLPLKG